MTVTVTPNGIISIHALRIEGDASYLSLAADKVNFNPRPPYRGRHDVAEIYDYLGIISIHALRIEGDVLTRA